MLKVGSKLLCKFGYDDILISGEEYTIMLKKCPSGNKDFFIKNMWLTQGVYNKHFYSEKEYRKMKLSSIDENRLL